MKKLKDFLPFICSILCALGGLIYYIFRVESVTYFVILEIVLCPFLTLLIPLYNKIRKRNIPFLLNVIVATHIFLAVDLGTACGFYNLFQYYDVIVHGLFGLVGGLFLYTYCVYYLDNQTHKAFILVIVFLCVMGLAGLWEIFEYLCDLVFNGDAQRVQESIALGKSPISDTMEDIMITAVGVLVFYLILLIDKKKQRINNYLIKEKNINENLKK
jgi:hypothetical protein